MLRADFCLNPPGIHLELPGIDLELPGINLELPGIDLESPGIPGKNLEFHEKSEKPGITWNWIQILPMCVTSKKPACGGQFPYPLAALAIFVSYDTKRGVQENRPICFSEEM